MINVTKLKDKKHSISKKINGIKRLLIKNKSFNYFLQLKNRYLYRKKINTILKSNYLSIVLQNISSIQILNKSFNSIHLLLELRLDIILNKILYFNTVINSIWLIKNNLVKLNNKFTNKLVICNLFDYIRVNHYINYDITNFLIKIKLITQILLSIKNIIYKKGFISNYTEIDYKLISIIIIKMPLLTDNHLIKINKKNYCNLLQIYIKYIYLLY